jgi:hypothetical protein
MELEQTSQVQAEATQDQTTAGNAKGKFSFDRYLALENFLLAGWVLGSWLLLYWKYLPAWLPIPADLAQILLIFVPILIWILCFI